MGEQTAEKLRVLGGLADKRQAILAGAFTVFARDGYNRASIDAIAGEANVSTRTIYNHFRDKAHLFQTVMETSAERVAEAQIAIMDRHLRRVADLEADLVEFARAWVAPTPDHGAHYSLVRQIEAEAAHIPPPAIQAWQEAGPLRVRQELALRFQRLADAGMLRVDHPDRAALHFSQLISGTDPWRRPARTDPELAELITSAVHAFLHGYIA